MSKAPVDRSYADDLKFYYTPVLILGVFLLIAIFAIYPSTISLIDNTGRVNELQDDADKKQVEIDARVLLVQNDVSTKQYLEKINTIAPIGSTNVTEFQRSIKTVAKANRLNVIGARGGEEIIAEENTLNSFQLVEVPMHFNLVGGFSNLKNFLADIYIGTDFIVIQKMDLGKDFEQSGDWTMDLTLVKYQFVDIEKTDEEAVIQPASSNAQPKQEVLDFLDLKY